MVHRFFTGFLLTFFLGFSSLYAQGDNPEWFLDRPIKEIRFEGLSSVSRSELEGITKNYLMKPFTRDLFREMASRLYSLDYFEGLIEEEIIKLDPEGLFAGIIFKVKEKPSISNIIIEGNNRISGSEITGVISTKKNTILKESSLRLDEGKIRELLYSKGFIKGSVSYSQKPDTGANSLTVTFTIVEGQQTVVKTIDFLGLSFASASSLKAVLKSKETNLFESGAFREQNLKEDQLQILNYYGNRGYIDARVMDIQRKSTIDEVNQREVLELVYTIEEGQPYVFEGMTFLGNSIFSNEDLLGKIKSVPGKLVNNSKLEADIQTIRDQYYENGYIFTEINAKEIKKDNKLQVSLVFNERPRAHIENIILKGNTKTQDKVILREIPLIPGDVFSKSKLIEGVMNLRNLQFFNGVPQIDTPQGSAEQLMDLVLTVEEAQTAEVMFGLSFSGATEFPVTANLKWQDKNFFGNGNVFGLELNASPVEQSLSFSYSEPWFMDKPISLGGSLQVGHFVKNRIQQDVLFPVYDTTTPIPDPYDESVYVFTKDTDYLGTTYHAGDIFPGLVTSSTISQYGLKTMYSYDLENNTLKSGQNLMSYDAFIFSMSLFAGYRVPTPFGRFNVQGGARTNPQFVLYDEKLYRPANKSLRDNLNQWKIDNSLWASASFDFRDFVGFPTSGMLFGDTITNTGGFLGGQTHFIRNDFKFEAYAKLFDWNLSETWDNITGSNSGTVDPSIFRMIFAFRSILSQLFEPLGNEGLLVTQPKDELFVDGSRNGRGWSQQTGGRLVWTASGEFRVPLVEQFLAWETFLDASLLIPMANKTEWINTTPLDQWKFGLGTGLRIISPSFPIGLFLAKPFTIGSNGLNWEKGDGLMGDLDLKLVISIGFNM